LDRSADDGGLRRRQVIWYLDRPVSNSGRLKRIMTTWRQSALAVAGRMCQNPDEVLAATDEIIVTADSVVLDRCQRCST